MPEASTSTAAKPRDQRRSRKRELLCPAHPDQLLAGGGKRYYLHLLSAEELRQRGMPAAKAKLLISAYAGYTPGLIQSLNMGLVVAAAPPLPVAP